MRYKGIGIYDYYNSVELIDNHYYGMLFTPDNSAPCSQCAFFKPIKCCHPNKEKRKCKHESGTNKGWNTTEYVYIHKEYVVEVK